MVQMTLLDSYRQRLQEDGFREDPAQVDVLEALQQVAETLDAPAPGDRASGRAAGSRSPSRSRTATA